MLKLGRVTKIKMLFLLLVFVFNFDLFKFSAAILEKGLLRRRLLLILHAKALIVQVEISLFSTGLLIGRI